MWLFDLQVRVAGLATAVLVAGARFSAFGSAGVVAPEPVKSVPTAAVHALELKPGSNDAVVIFWVARLLEKQHYRQEPFDEVTSSKFLDLYIRSLDPQRMHFLQTDLAEFEGYRYRLHRLSLRLGDTSPAYVIFAMFMRRLEQRVQYALELLDTEKFTFDTDERVVLNRRDLPHPKDLAEAKMLWRDRLRAEYLQEKLDGKKHEEIVDILKRRYNRTLKSFKEWDSENVLEVYLSALANAYDPHSDFMSKSSADNFAINMNLSLFGIGATLMSEDGYCKITELVPGGPAARSGKLKVGDRIVAVAQGDEPPVDIVDMPLRKAVQLIRGPKGTVVRLTIIPAGATDTSVRKTVTLVRDEIKLEERAAKGKIVDMPRPGGGKIRLGIIELPSFYGRVDFGAGATQPEGRSAAQDVAKLLRKFKAEGVQGVILDLRRNGGGALDEAIKVTGLFIEQGPVVQVRDFDGTVTIERDTDPEVVYEGPLIVLTSRFSASGAEIVAGALQDYGRAIVVGESATYGKGTVQKPFPLGYLIRQTTQTITNDPGTLLVTIRKFYRPSGRSTQLKGVTPDIVLPSVNNVAEIGESALDNPLDWDMIPSVKYPQFNLVEPFVAELRARSDARIATDPEFAYIREDVERAKKLLADKSVSLNESQRRKEKEEAEQRDKQRQRERLARAQPERVVYEIPIRLADVPGLPAPTHTTAGLAAATNSILTTATTNARFTLPVTTTNSAAEARLAQTKTMTAPEPTAASAPGDERERGEQQAESHDEDKTAAPDAHLEEAERILVDYIQLLASARTELANRAQSAAGTNLTAPQNQLAPVQR
ncbi:MAG: carboxy terminal-processing peptidase [Verrucomicrobiae bacterium]|nr:carboxy terminal-processing peptidase [Verrucomicrobiae bacterium]MDW7979843.1 carboxy terminal-processing peptidase [Verrucomicrobiales bacterium]